MAAPVNLLPHHGEVFLYPSFFSEKRSEELLAYFLNRMAWRQNPVKLFGREVLQPRLSCSFADGNVEYGYSGVRLKSHSWTKELLQIKQPVEAVAGQKFNTALLNLYRDGKDYMGWHRDNEKHLGPEPLIASVSFGAVRKFQLRNYHTKGEIISLDLLAGSLLLMGGASQHHWEHRLPKDSKVRGPRVNITFRSVISET